ncbi:MAG: glycosyltransferase family 2 protein [Butyrivibrio sp.]|nr:glycosyltransferase family 2 protein [Butyrivibrio sp.]
MKKVSIIISCFNASEWLWDAFNSLKNQTMGIDDLECIFIDDASTDDGKTWGVLTEIEKEAPESVMLIHLDENMRQGGARNIGMQYMTGKYMLFLDADDMYRPETCQELYDLAEKYDADMIQFDHDIVWRDMGDNSFPPREDDEDSVFVSFDEDDNRRPMLSGETGDFGCTNKIYRTDLIRRSEASFAEHKVYEEPKFVYPQFLYARNILYITTKYYIYRKHEGSTMTSLLGDRLLEHPKVQLELQEYLIAREALYQKYRQEIEYHFLYSFYEETIVFSVVNKGLLPLPFFKEMQRICKSLVPDPDRNKYIAEDLILKEAMEALDISFENQDELNTYIFAFVKKYLTIFVSGIDQ